MKKYALTTSAAITFFALAGIFSSFGCGQAVERQKNYWDGLGEDESETDEDSNEDEAVEPSDGDETELENIENEAASDDAKELVEDLADGETELDEPDENQEKESEELPNLDFIIIPTGDILSKRIRVVEGTFYMGCNEDYDDSCLSDELPYHGVALDAFEIDEKEVTLVQYAKCVKSRKCPFDGLETSDAGEEWSFACNWGKRSHENYPMNCVSWEQAEAYCKTYGLRLPTEAEWEKASRGDTGWKYSWGNEGFDTWGNIGVAVANVADKQTKDKYGDLVTWAVSFYDDGSALTAVGMGFVKGKSPYGVYDMIGNVSEWCSDWYGGVYYSAADSRDNPTGPSEGEFKIIRGGSWRERLSGDRASARFKKPPNKRYDDVGFRCAKSI